MTIGKRITLAVSFLFFLQQAGAQGQLTRILAEELLSMLIPFSGDPQHVLYSSWYISCFQEDVHPRLGGLTIDWRPQLRGDSCRAWQPA